MDKKSTICLWVDGIGLSSSWSGNAFMSANPKNFLDAWVKYRRTTVSPCFNLKSEIENIEIDFTRVNGGENYSSDKAHLDQYIKNDELEKNKELLKILNETTKRNSAVHLIGNLPSTKEGYSSFLYLESLLKCIHQDRRIQVYIHLILGDDLETDQKSQIGYLAQYQEAIKPYPSVETASISGQGYFLNSKASKKAIEAILFGRGTPSLTLEQAFSGQKNSAPFDKAPTSIIYRDSFTFKIKNFDTVLFFNHNSKHLSSFMQTMTTELIGSLQMPKFLQIGVFFDPFYGKNNKITELIERKFDDILFSTLNDQYKLSIVADKTGIDNFAYAGITKNYKIIEFENYELVEQNLEKLINNENKLVFLYLNLLSKISSTTDFKDAEKAVNEFDQFLGKVINLVSKDNTGLILFSSRAGLERLTNRNNIEKMSGKTISPLPFMVIDKENEKTVSSKVMFYDMIKDRQSLVDIVPTIFDLLGISNNGTLKGKSFNKEIK